MLLQSQWGWAALTESTPQRNVDALAEKPSELSSQKEPIEVAQPNPIAHVWGVGIGLGLSIGGSITWKFATKWTGRFSVVDEGWFRRNTYAGGADKLGHMYTDFVLGRGLFHLYRAYNYSRKDSVFYSFVSGSVARTIMELADGFTTYQFSAGDLLFNLLGSSSNALLLLDPKIEETFYMSWSYWPSDEVRAGHHDAADFSTDYSGMVFGFNADVYGLRRLAGQSSSHWSDYTYLGLNYFTRNFRQPDKENRERIVGASVGLAAHRFFRKDSIVGSTLRYVKIPLTYTGVQYSLDREKVDVLLGINLLN